MTAFEIIGKAADEIIRNCEKECKKKPIRKLTCDKIIRKIMEEDEESKSIYTFVTRHYILGANDENFEKRINESALLELLHGVHESERYIHIYEGDENKESQNTIWF
jgi:hypothetical protein